MPLSILSVIKYLLGVLQNQVDEMQDSMIESSNDIGVQDFNILIDKLGVAIKNVDGMIWRIDQLEHETEKQKAGLAERMDALNLQRKKRNESELVEDAFAFKNLRYQVDRHTTKGCRNSSMSIPKHRKAPAPPKCFSIKRALYDFQAAADDELSIMEGDILVVVDDSIEFTRDGWCMARLRRTTLTGLVPVSYLGTKEDLQN